VKKRATIVISGEVQDVGFRGKVMRIGQKSDLVGYTQNSPDGTVIVVCQGEEKAIKKFAKSLKIRNGDIKVDKVDVKWSKTLGEFKYFEVRVTNLGNEMFQGFATAGRMLGSVAQKVDNVGKKVDDVGKKVDNVGEKIDSMHGDMNERFDTLDKKYGKINNKMSELTAELHRSTDALVEMTQKVGALIDRKLAE
jgi:acylphosphatase